jgi:hypothetical protein
MSCCGTSTGRLFLQDVQNYLQAMKLSCPGLNFDRSEHFRVLHALRISSPRGNCCQIYQLLTGVAMILMSSQPCVSALRN